MRWWWLGRWLSLVPERDPSAPVTPLDDAVFGGVFVTVVAVVA